MDVTLYTVGCTILSFLSDERTMVKGLALLLHIVILGNVDPNCTSFFDQTAVSTTSSIYDSNDLFVSLVCCLDI